MSEKIWVSLQRGRGMEATAVNTSSSMEATAVNTSSSSPQLQGERGVSEYEASTIESGS